MMISPDIHIVITITEEVVFLGCATIAFAITAWAVVKLATILKQKAND